MSAPSNDICQTLREWYERVPAVSLIVMYILIGLYAFSFIPNFPLLSSISTAIVSGEVWLLFTGSFVTWGILDLLITLLMYMPTACDSERRIGSIKYLTHFLVNCETHSGLLIQVLCLGIVVAFYGLDVAVNNTGLWGIIMLEIVIRCNRDPEAAVAMWCCPATIKSKYYPWFLVLIFSLFGFRLPLWVGLGVGYLRKAQSDVYEYMSCLQLSDSKASRLQECVPCRWLGSVKGFVTVENSGLPFAVVQRVQSTPSAPQLSNPQFVPFSGRGFTIQDSNSPSAPRIQPSRYNPQQDEDEI